jgi:Xaa-Pro aminopeptidase
VELREHLSECRPGSESAPADMSAFMTQMRMIKEPCEISLIEEAIAITGRGIEAMMRRVQPGLMEYHLWNDFRSSLALEGCLEPAFPSIVAAGANTFCLHYMQPAGCIREGDLVQVDVGASCGGLCADISRAFPASGRFSPRQLAIYQLVRNCQDMAFASIRPGEHITEINERCREVAREGLTALGIMGKDGSIGEYCWHGVSHHLGLDVHDVSNREAILQEGMVLTVEPGIYVQAWQVGLRIEDDVLVTSSGCRNLSAALPREAGEIEAVCQRDMMQNRRALHRK